MSEAELLQIATSAPMAAPAVCFVVFGVAPGYLVGVFFYCVLAYMAFFYSWKLQARHPD